MNRSLRSLSRRYTHAKGRKAVVGHTLRTLEHRQRVAVYALDMRSVVVTRSLEISATSERFIATTAQRTGTHAQRVPGDLPTTS